MHSNVVNHNSIGHRALVSIERGVCLAASVNEVKMVDVFIKC